MRTLHCVAALAVACATRWALAADLGAFAGDWVIRGSVVAPWADPKFAPGDVEAKRLAGKSVVFGSRRVTGPSPIGCTGPAYKVEEVGPDMLFEGELSESRDGRPADALRAATSLGFTRPQRIATLDAGCTEVQFHEMRPGVVAFGLNNRVYTMVRR